MIFHIFTDIFQVHTITQHLNCKVTFELHLWTFYYLLSARDNKNYVIVSQAQHSVVLNMEEALSGDIDRWIETARKCQYLAEKDLKVSAL